ncbi:MULTISPECIES: DUF6895 family protein [Streptomyces]|uniref:DUF6895 family protein n=1 Tax=Streptomyces TaxID=1883 RepID=UPI00062520BF|nr:MULTISPECIES: hypothetical protein [Streptomyces]QXE33368.1 hypothetical protein KQY30_02725 [Streptomyces sp. GMY02]
MPMPVTQTAHRITSRALTWLHSNREHSTLPPGTTAELAEPDSVYKPLGETALAASLVLREAVAGSTELRLARELLDFSWEQLGAGAMLHERLLRYPMMSDPLETYTHFARSGYRHEGLDRLLAHTTSLRSARAVEVMPNRRLAIANAARVGGFDQGDRAADWAALTRATWLGALPEPWLIDWMTAYHMTHTVFHLTDWGRVPADLPVELAAYLTDWLPAWIDIWAEIAEWDLVAELMIVGSSLPDPLCDPADWERLARLQHEDGLMPRDGHPVAGDAGERFAAHHHTTVVAAVAGTLAVSRTLGTRR